MENRNNSNSNKRKLDDTDESLLFPIKKRNPVTYNLCELENTLIKNQEEIQLLNNTIAELKQQKASLSSKLDEQKALPDQCLKIIELSQKKDIELLKVVPKYENEIHTYKNVIENLNSDILKIKYQHNIEKSNLIQQHTLQYKDKNTLIEKLINKNKGQEEQLKNSKEENIQNKDEIIRLKTENDNLKKQIDTQKNETNQLVIKLFQTKDELDRTKEQFESFSKKREPTPALIQKLSTEKDIAKQYTSIANENMILIKKPGQMNNFNSSEVSQTQTGSDPMQSQSHTHPTTVINKQTQSAFYQKASQRPVNCSYHLGVFAVPELMKKTAPPKSGIFYKMDLNDPGLTHEIQPFSANTPKASNIPNTLKKNI